MQCFKWTKKNQAIKYPLILALNVSKNVHKAELLCNKFDFVIFQYVCILLWLYGKGLLETNEIFP